MAKDPAFANLDAWDRQLGAAYAADLERATGMTREQREAAKEARRAQEEKELRDRPGALEALGRGGLQGVTLGFSDEIGGVLKSAFGPRTYAQERDTIRSRNRAAQEAEPLAYGLGDVLGGVATAAVPVAGALGAGARAARAGSAALRGAATGAVEGAAQGVGYSEATDLAGVLADAGKSAVVGGALGAGAGKVVDEVLDAAPARADKALLSEIGDRAKPTTRAKMADAEGPVLDAARAHGLEDIAGDASKLAPAATAAKKETGSKIGSAFDDIDQNVGVLSKDLFSSLSAVKRELGSPSDAPLRARLEKYIEDAQGRWGGERRIKLSDLNDEIGKLEKAGFKSADLDVADGARLKRMIAGALEGRLQTRLAEIKKFGDNVAASGLGARPAFSSAVDAGEATKALPGLNRDYRGLSLIEKAGKERERLGKFSPTGLRSIFGQGVNQLSGGLSLLSGNPLPVLASTVGLPLARKAASAATKALAKVSRQARDGNVKAAAVVAAIRAGVPLASVQNVLGLYRQAMPAGVEDDLGQP